MESFIKLAPDVYRLSVPFPGCWAGAALVLGKENIVLLSTHIVSDVEHIADRILMMREGQIIWQGVWNDTDGSLEEFYLKEFS